MKNTQDCTDERITSKGLGCLPSSALFNVISSTSLNLNVPATTGLLEFLTTPFSMCLDLLPVCLHESSLQCMASIVAC